MKIWFASRPKGVVSHPLVQRHAQHNQRKLVGGILPPWQNRPENEVERIGWGYKPSGLWAKQGDRFRLFEDGFIRSIRPGYHPPAPLYSLVEDRTGIYYDGNADSDLIRLIESLPFPKPGETNPTTELIELYRQIGASKYNYFPYEFEGKKITDIILKPGVLVIDQTAGDAAIQFGNGLPKNFEQMLTDALDFDPGSPVYLRTHPDAKYRSGQSCFPDHLLRNDRVIIIPPEFAPYQIFPHISTVFAFSSLMGLEALIHRCTVHCYGCSFYAGWGLTTDHHPQVSERIHTRLKLESLFKAAFEDYSLYFDSTTGARTTLRKTLRHIEIQKDQFSRNAGAKVYIGFPNWKEKLIKDFLYSPTPPDLSGDSTSVVWGRASSKTSKPMRVEDGFLRSKGLGAEFHRPLSLVADRQGIYFDATVPSDLESILQNTDFKLEEFAKAKQLIAALISSGVSKYNLDQTTTTATWPDTTGKVRILVPGQVEQDASLQYGLTPFATNLDFLQAVRRSHPDAIIAYKPHPDLVRKQRAGSAINRVIGSNCDLVVTDLNIVPWIATCDQLHTQTSLSGFEALLRGKQVHCYGLPFYAGWGLTTDSINCERRTRKLSIEELVAGALMRYPIYLNPHTGEFIEAITAIDLLQETSQNALPQQGLTWWTLAILKKALHPFRK